MEVTYKSKFNKGDVVYIITPVREYNNITRRRELEIQKRNIKKVIIQSDGNVLYELIGSNEFLIREEYISKTNTKEFKNKCKEANRNDLKERESYFLTSIQIRESEMKHIKNSLKRVRAELKSLK